MRAESHVDALGRESMRHWSHDHRHRVHVSFAPSPQAHRDGDAPPLHTRGAKDLVQREIDRVHFLSGGVTANAGPPSTLAAPTDPSRCPKPCGVWSGLEHVESLSLPEPPSPADIIAPLLFTNSGTMLDLFA